MFLDAQHAVSAHEHTHVCSLGSSARLLVADTLADENGACDGEAEVLGVNEVPNEGVMDVDSRGVYEFDPVSDTEVDCVRLSVSDGVTDAVLDLLRVSDAVSEWVLV